MVPSKDERVRFLEFQERDRAVFEQVTEEEFDIMLRFSEKYGAHLDAEIKKLGVDMKSEDYDKL